MITLRMIGIAVAILLGLPIATVLADHVPGHVQVPGGELVNAGAREAGRISDIVLIRPPPTYERTGNEFRPEQVVEGHIVFVTIDIQLVEKVSNFTFDIAGNISCELHSSGEGEFFGGIVPVPRQFDEFHEECEAAGVVFVTPDPFIDSQNADPPTSAALQPNGRTFQRQAPNGEWIEITEYEFTKPETDWMGETTGMKTYYAWSVPTITPWTHDDGSTKKWFCPIPEDRLGEMGETHFTAFLESAFAE